MKAIIPSGPNQNGFILVATMVILLLLVIMGLAATMTGTFETQIAGNEKAYKTNFYATDGSVDLGELLIEENLSCPGGFEKYPSTESYADIPHASPQIRVTNPDFAWDSAPAASAAWNNKDAFFPSSLGPPSTEEIQGQTYLKAGGETYYSHGGSLQMAAGYLGKGKSAAGGGSHRIVTMYARRKGQSNSISEIKIDWRHVVGQEGGCNY